MKHGNISIFVPHNGCPHQCSFCNQRSITGVVHQPDEEDVDKAVEQALSSRKKYDYEIAFFGGSFTAIERDYMISLLQAAYKYVENKTVRGIRISTRPDAIDDEVMSVLKRYGVDAVELGAQSMCDDVLLMNQRGHTAEDVRTASSLIKKYGISLGLQMMTGLFGSSEEKDILTAKKIIELKPDTVRIYPTVTLGKTMLGELYENGRYKPQELSESVNLCALLLKMFSENNIEVIRLGLHYSEELEKSMLFNNYHPAFKELCESRIMLDEFVKIISEGNFQKGSLLKVSVNPSSVSKFVGQKKSNIIKIKEMGFDVKIVQDRNLSAYELSVV